MGTITTTLVSGQNATVGIVTSRSPYSVTVTGGPPGPAGDTGPAGNTGADGVSVVSVNVEEGSLIFTLSNTSTINAGTFDTLVSNGYTVVLESNGAFTLSNNSRLVTSADGIDLVASEGGWAELASNNENSYMWVDNDSAYIGTNWSISPKQWSFNATGTLVFPDSTSQNTAFSTNTSYTWSNVQTFSNTVNFNGNINVNGNTNYFTSNNIVYTDALVEIHAPGGNTANVWNTNDGSDIGLRFHYYNGADKNAGLFMDNGTWRLKWVVDGTESAGQFSHTGSLGDIEANTVYANLVGTANNANNLGGVAAASYLQTNTAISVTNITATGNISGNTAGFAIGYRDIPQLLSNTSVTIANTDMGKHYYCANTTSMVFTVANSTNVPGIPIGAAITVVSYGTGNVVITRGTGVTMYLAANSTSADRTLGAYGVASLLKVAADTWVISGAGVT